MRTRLVHPEICADNVVGALDPWAQVLYHRLPLLADRAGRFRYCPPLIWATVIPWYKGDTAALLETIAAAGLIRRYEVNGVQFADLPRFLEDQHPHPREAASQIPAYDSAVTKGNTLALPGQRLGAAEQLSLQGVSVSISESEHVSIGGVARTGRNSAPAENATPPKQIETLKPENTGAPTAAAGSELDADLDAELLAVGLEVLPGGAIRAVPPQAIRKPPATETQYAAHGAPQGEARPVEPVQVAGGPVVAAPGAKLAVMPSCADDDLLLVAGALSELAGLVRLPRPDEAIVHQVLDAGRGASGNAIHAVLVELYRRGRLRDMRSWGLLPILVGQWAAAA